MADSDAIKVSQGALGASVRKTPCDAETVFRRDCWGWQRADVEEDDNGRGRLEFLQEVDEDGRCTVWTAGLIEEDANTAESADWCTAHTGRETQYGCVSIFLCIFRQFGQ